MNHPGGGGGNHPHTDLHTHGPIVNKCMCVPLCSHIYKLHLKEACKPNFHLNIFTICSKKQRRANICLTLLVKQCLLMDPRTGAFSVMAPVQWSSLPPPKIDSRNTVGLLGVHENLVFPSGTGFRVLMKL